MVPMVGSVLADDETAEAVGLVEPPVGVETDGLDNAVEKEDACWHHIIS